MPKKWMGDKCIFCSICTALCSHDVFKQLDGKILVDIAKCVDCEECPPSVGCPRRAIS